MSDKQKEQKEKPWQEEMRELFRDSMREYLSSTKPSFSGSPPSSESKQHKTLDEIAACPNCHKEYHVDEYDQKVKASAREEMLKALKERGQLEYECKECGTGESEEEAKNGECPTCHGKHARRRS